MWKPTCQGVRTKQDNHGCQIRLLTVMQSVPCLQNGGHHVVLYHQCILTHALGTSAGRQSQAHEPRATKRKAARVPKDWLAGTSGSNKHTAGKQRGEVWQDRDVAVGVAAENQGLERVAAADPHKRNENKEQRPDKPCGGRKTPAGRLSLPVCVKELPLRLRY